MNTLTLDDLNALALGAAVLGSGGGGDPAYEILMATCALEQNGPVTLVDIADVKADDLVAPVAFMGAPLVSLERLPSGKEFSAILDAIEKKLGRTPTYLMPAEIGGANAFTPLLFGLPVLNADTIGRAFPELQMSSCNLKGVSPAPTFLADPFGNVEVIEPNNCHELEEHARDITVSMGSSALLATYLMRGDQVAASVVDKSYSKAIAIGKSIEQGTFAPKTLARGKIIDINQVVDAGFLKGTVTIDEGVTTCLVAYQNEYLLATRGDQILGVTPDILILLEEETNMPITSESLTYGVRCSLVELAGPDIWKTEKGLEMVGPNYFGYSS